MRYQKVISAAAAIAVLGSTVTGFALPRLNEMETAGLAAPQIVLPTAAPAAGLPEEGLPSPADEVPPEKESAEPLETETPAEATAKPEETALPEATDEPAKPSLIPEKPVSEADAVVDDGAAETVGVSELAPEVVKVGSYDVSDTVERYERFDYSDPGYITDELLFGQWDTQAGSWIPQDNQLVINNNLPYSKQNDKPLLDYSQPGLEKVEAAVKVCDGNYTKPKALLLQYYREKFKGLNKDVTVNGTKAQTVRSKALAYNFVIKEFTAVDLFDVTPDKTYYEFDVTDQISTIVSGTGTKKFCFVMNALELDGAKASFGARESELKPYVILSLTDGTTRTIYPEADCTIKGGSNASKSFPSETELFVQERKSVGVENDNNSQRALVRFDFSSIAQGTRVKSASFGICGWTDKTDAAQKIFLGSTTNVTWAENGLTWKNSNFTNNISFDTQAGMISSVFKDNYYAMGSAASVLAARYLYDEEEIYAYHAIRYMVQYHINIDTRKYAYNDFLAKGVNGLELANSFYSVIDSDYMTPEAFGILIKSVYCNTEWILEGWNTNSAALNSNHATYYNRGFAALITLFTEFYKANDPLQDDPSYKGLYYGGRGGWIPSLQRRVLYKAKEVSFPDGAGKEVAGGYNMEAYANTVGVLQFATEAKMPEILPDEYYDMMAIAALYFMHGMAPGYRDWGVGNSYGYGSQFINRPVIKQIIDGLAMLLEESDDKTSADYLRRKEQYDQLIYAYTAGKNGEMPAFESILYPLARKVVMRDSWDENAVGATMGISNGGIHSHFDDLSIVIAAYGRYLLADPGKVDYVENEPYKCWLNSTRAHNTIEINDISQRSGFWSNWEVAKGPANEALVFPFRNDHGLILANNVIADAVEEPQNADYKAILNQKNYIQSNLKRLYDFDDQLAVQANPSVKTRNFQGRFLESEMNPTFDYVKGETYNNIGVKYKDDGNVLGKGVKEYTAPDNAHNRSMLFVKSEAVPSFYIVTDYVAPVNGNNQENKYSQAWHFANDADISMDQATKTVRTNYNDANLAVVPVLGKEIETEAELQDGWYHTSANVPAKYVTYVKRASEPTTFNTILLPMDAGKDYSVGTELIELSGLSEAEASAFTFEMRETHTGKTAYGTYYNLHDGSRQSERKVGEYTTDARMLYADKNDSYYTTAVLTDGTQLKDGDGRTLIQSKQNISHLGVEWSSYELRLSASQTDPQSAEYVDLSKLTVLAQRSVSKVTFNGEEIPFQIKDGYLYFGDKPVIDDPDYVAPTPTPVPSKKPGSGHGGSGGGSGGGSSVPSAATPTPVTPAPSGDPELSEINPAFAAELNGHWGKTEIAALVRDGVVNGVSDTSLGLEQPVTRAEFTALLIRALGIEEAPYQGEFADVSPDAWYAVALSTAKRSGILEGDEAGYANPDAFITREQMAKMAVVALERCKGIRADGAQQSSFTDFGTISGWAREYVAAAESLGVMKGLDDGSFAPQEQVPREQAMVLTYRLRKK